MSARGSGLKFAPVKHGDANLSENGVYRYALTRRWTDVVQKTAVFIMLNPSTADATANDPTIRKCVGFAQRWGMDAIAVVNLFAFRASKPVVLRLAADKVGPENDEWIRGVTIHSPGSSIIAAWGANGADYPDRVRHVYGLVGRAMRALTILNSGHPAHPLMIPYSACPQPWSLDNLKPAEET